MIRKSRNQSLRTLVLGFAAATLAITIHPVQASEIPFSNSEGILSSAHDSELERLREKYFTTQGELDPSKLEKLISRFKNQREVLAESVRMTKKVELISLFGYTEQEAEKSTADEVEGILAFDIVIEGAQKLLASAGSLPISEQEKELDRLLLFASACETLNPQTYFSGYLKILGNLRKAYQEVPLGMRSDRPEASNLWNGQKFLSPSEILVLGKQGADLSKINPPQSAFWSDNAVENYDPGFSEIGGELLFPPEETEVIFKRWSTGTIKLKADWVYKNSKGKKIKKKLSLRLGKEAATTVLSGHLGRAVGFPTLPSALRKRLTLKLPSDLTYESFLAQWRLIHGDEDGTAVTYVDRYDPDSHTVVLKNVCVESTPDGEQDYEKIGPFLSGRNGFTNRREYRAQMIYHSLIALSDTQDRQNRLEAYKDKQGNWQPIIYTRDTGTSFGEPLLYGSASDVNSYIENLASRRGDRVRISWDHLLFHPKTYESTTFADARWILRRYARLSGAQIDAMAASSGLPEPVALLYAEKIKRRLNSLFREFRLLEEGISPFQTRSYSELSRQFPETISPRGQLLYAAENLDGNTYPLFGYDSSIRETIVRVGLLGLANQLSRVATAEVNSMMRGDVIKLGSFQMSGGISVSGQRKILLNHERSRFQKRFIAADTVTVQIAAGALGGSPTERGIHGPAQVYYQYIFTHFHGFTDVREAATSKFFESMNPFSLPSIRSGLKPGEALRVQHRMGANIGRLEAALNDDYELALTPFSPQAELIKELYVSRPDESQIEVYTARIFDKKIVTNLDLSIYLKFSYQQETGTRTGEYKLYRFNDRENATESDRNQIYLAWRSILEKNDFSLAEKVGRVLRLKSREDYSARSSAFILPQTSHARSLQELEIDFEDQATSNVSDARVIDPDRDGTRVVIRGAQQSEKRKNIGDLFTTPIPQLITSLGKVIGAIRGERLVRTVRVEALLDADEYNIQEQDIWITLKREDNEATRKEFEQNFIQFFNRRSGPLWTRASPHASDVYFKFEAPPEIERYSPLHGQMTWQISNLGLNRLIEQLKLSSVQEELANNQSIKWYQYRGVHNRSYMRNLNALLRKVEAPIPAVYSREARRQALKNRVGATMDLLRFVVGSDGHQLGWLRRWISEDDFWLTTEISAPFDSSIPVALGDTALWAPEVGKYQGASYLSRLRRSFRFLPGLYRGDGVGSFDSTHFDVDGVGPLGDVENFRLVRLPAF